MTDTIKKTFIDYMSEEEYNRYNELLAKAAEAKANAPKVSKPRGPMTIEQKKKLAEARLAKAQAMFDKIMAELNIEG